MADSRVALRYVKSLLDLAVEQKALDAVHDDMLLFSVACGNKGFVEMLRSPVIRHEDKRLILRKIFAAKVHPTTLAIFEIITRKNREPLLPEIASNFHKAYNEHKGIGSAKVTSPVALDDKLRDQIRKIASGLTGTKEIELTESVDASLLGGFVLNVGDRQFDSSLKSRLKSLKRKFTENPYHKVL
jgi:F-type H+-transporting ATPase subunit delta